MYIGNYLQSFSAIVNPCFAGSLPSLIILSFQPGHIFDHLCMYSSKHLNFYPEKVWTLLGALNLSYQLVQVHHIHQCYPMSVTMEVKIPFMYIGIRRASSSSLQPVFTRSLHIATKPLHPTFISKIYLSFFKAISSCPCTAAREVIVSLPLCSHYPWLLTMGSNPKLSWLLFRLPLNTLVQLDLGLHTPCNNEKISM